ncbi:K(+)-stimulated pyrophosphate-energized sodium pump [Anaerolineae bacterium]|nr:K(+)-stimulated pyrophosphate-energized sodium pump [Anaerolineae bacterium]
MTPQILKISDLERTMIYGVLGIAIAGILYAVFLALQILREPKGSVKMQEVWNDIKTGANAYLRSQFRIIAILIVVMMVVLFLSVFVIKPTPYSVQQFCPELAKTAEEDYLKANPDSARILEEAAKAGASAEIQTQAAGVRGQLEASISKVADQCESARNNVAFGRAGGFLMGALFSAMVGFIGMNMAVQGNVRVAAAAVDTKRGYKDALRIAYRSGTITGMLTDGLGLFGGTIIFLLFGLASPDTLLGFGFGGTLLALFMRVGGGIYTKAADVGADLVGKVEAGLPEDDPRNAAVIADLVGDNVGDCAGMAADIFESYEVTIVSALILGLALSFATGTVIWIIFPLVVRGIGVLASIIGTYFVRSSNEEKDALGAIFRGFRISAAISVVMFIILTLAYMRDPAGNLIWQPLAATVIGVALAIIIERVTGFFTETERLPVRDIARNAQTGPATVILSGLSWGMESSVWSILVIAGSILGSLLVFTIAPLPGVDAFSAILYGVAMTGIGMLTLTGNNVSMDAFGPISDNAQGVAELAGEATGEGAKTLEQLDAVGNTTKAITKGVAIGSAVIAAVSLFGAFLTDTRIAQLGSGVAIDQTLFAKGINIAEPLVFIGMLVGGGLIFLFSSLLINSVNRAAFDMINVVRRQLRIPGIMEGTKKPDYAECVSVSTMAAQRELMPLGAMAIFIPLVVGFLLGAPALGGFLAGIILTGQLMAVFMSNAGGAWDNAKKHVEQGHYGGKRSEAHKATVVGDTVGDPFKDTAGPALNPMIKVVNLVSLLAAPIIVTYFASLKQGELSVAQIVVFVVSALLLGVVFWIVTRAKHLAKAEAQIIPLEPKTAHEALESAS